MSSRKQLLKQRLREKLAAQKMGRSSKLTLKLQKETSTDIYVLTELLMRDTAILSARGVKNPVQRAKMLKKQQNEDYDKGLEMFVEVLKNLTLEDEELAEKFRENLKILGTSFFAISKKLPNLKLGTMVVNGIHSGKQSQS